MVWLPYVILPLTAKTTKTKENTNSRKRVQKRSPAFFGINFRSILTQFQCLSVSLSISLSLSDLSLSQFHLLLQEMAGKQSKGRKPETLGKGKVTPTQIAFIVDRYLCDNNFSSTRSMFRNEASSLIANSPIHEVYTPFCSTFCFFRFSLSCYADLCIGVFIFYDKSCVF